MLTDALQAVAGKYELPAAFKLNNSLDFNCQAQLYNRIGMRIIPS